MVSLKDVQASNARIPSELPPDLVAVFVGGTSGIGEYSLKAFAKRGPRPRIVNIGRNREAARRIGEECKQLNAEVQYEFKEADTSVLATVDRICNELSSSLPYINILFISTGMLGGSGVNTSEGLHLPASLLHHSRIRFTLNLLPLIQRAPGVRRVVSVLAAGKEGPLLSKDIQARDVPMKNIHKIRGHGASLVTFGLEKCAEKAPDVTFIHSFPGPVRSNLGRRGQGFVVGLITFIFDRFIMPFKAIPEDECGERHLFLSTSAKFAAAMGEGVEGIKAEGVKSAIDTYGREGGGMYSVDEKCEDTGTEVVQRLEGLRAEGVQEEIWRQTVEEYVRITGRESVSDGAQDQVEGKEGEPELSVSDKAEEAPVEASSSPQERQKSNVETV